MAADSDADVAESNWKHNVIHRGDLHYNEFVVVSRVGNLDDFRSKSPNILRPIYKSPSPII